MNQQYVKGEQKWKKSLHFTDNGQYNNDHTGYRVYCSDKRKHLFYSKSRNKKGQV